MIYIPKIKDEELLRKYDKIKPIIKIDNIYYKLRKYNLEQLKNYSYIIDRFQTKEDIIKEENISVIDEFSCYHVYGYYGLFQPKVYEVLSQHPEKHLNDSNAFYIYDAPRSKEELENQKDIINNGYYKTKVKILNIKK